MTKELENIQAWKLENIQAWKHVKDIKEDLDYLTQFFIHMDEQWYASEWMYDDEILANSILLFSIIIWNRNAHNTLNRLEENWEEFDKEKIDYSWAADLNKAISKGIWENMDDFLNRTLN